MYFRAQRKLQGEVSLSDPVETDKEGNALELIDIVGTEDTLMEDLYQQESARKLRRFMGEVLTARESEIIRLRYGLGGTVPLTQREIAAAFGISRSYVSRRHYCKRCLESLEKQGLPDCRKLQKTVKTNCTYCKRQNAQKTKRLFITYYKYS